MPHRTYISAWLKDFSEPVMLERIERFLELVPLSTSVPGFTSLVIRALGPEESPIIERDLRRRPLTPAELAPWIDEHLHADSCYEFEAYWDLWVPDASLGVWQQSPQRLELLCNGVEYDRGGFIETGHFWAHIGFEPLFLGQPETLATPAGREKIKENASRLLEWAHQMQAKLPLERLRIWSEGEEDFEARLEEALARG